MCPRTNKTVWGKMHCGLSIYQVRLSHLVEGSRSIVLLFAAVCLLSFWPTATVVAGTNNQETTRFDIPQQRADRSLIKFAEQADITLIFTFELARDRTTNRLVGSYHIDEGIQLLLDGTGLKPTFSSDGHINIALAEMPVAEREYMNVKKKGLWAALTSIFVVSGAAAQEEPETGVSAIEEVIVTATYRKSSLMDTSMSISALDQSVIDEMGARDMSDVYRQIPGLNMSGTTTGANRYTIRGVSSQTGTSFQNYTLATVGVYLDDTPVTSATGPAAQMSGNMFDINRVEVLKGPQGTLFGEGSQGGTIRYLYNQPQAESFEVATRLGASQMGHSSDDSHRIDAMVNVPIVEGVLALRATGFDARTAGFIDNLTPPQKDFNPQETTGGRLALKYTPNEWLSLTGTGYFVDASTEGDSRALRPYEIGDLPPFPGKPPRSQDELKLYSLLAELSFGWADFTSATSYMDRDRASLSGLSRTTFGIYDSFAAFSFFLVDPTSPVPLDGMNMQAAVNDFAFQTERFVQEFRLVSAAGRLSWTAGLFYKDGKDRTDGLARLSPAPGREQFSEQINEFFLTPVNNHTDRLTEYAAFGEMSFDITDTLTLTAGARVSRLEQEIGVGEDTAATEDTPWSPKVVLSWFPNDDLLLYASYTTGFRPGNVNQPMAFYIEQNEAARDLALAAGDAALAADFQYELDRSVDHLTYNGDEISSYEAGMKTTWLDGRMQFIASAYYMDWEDMIQFYIDPDPIRVRGGRFVYNDNAGSALSTGIEAELNMALTDRLRLRLSGDFNKSELGSTTSAGEEGSRLTFAPEHSFAAMVDYTIPIGTRWALTLHADQAWVGEQYTDAANTPRQAIPSYATTNARVIFREASQDRWQAILFAKNLTDKEVLRQVETGIFDPEALYQYYDAPRQIGIELSWRM